MYNSKHILSSEHVSEICLFYFFFFFFLWAEQFIFVVRQSNLSLAMETSFIIGTKKVTTGTAD